MKTTHYYCDHCGNNIPEGKAHHVRELQQHISTANAGESATLCQGCFGFIENMPDPKPHGSRDTFVPPPLPEDVDVLELKRMLREFWISYPIIRHGLLLYREGAKAESTVIMANAVQHQLKELYDMAAKVCDLPKD